jgi:hypothetical protein
MDDDRSVAQVAREYVGRHGRDAPPMLRERADTAEGIGDHDSAKAWRDIADAAERMLHQFGPAAAG